jgi:hypothetical protein
METSTVDLQYPIGKFSRKPSADAAERDVLIQHIADAPTQLRQAVAGLTHEQVATPYRPGGWTVRQVVHHVADSHLNAYIRTKFALTEEKPTIMPYKQALWAELVDSMQPLEVSLNLLDALHTRWVSILRSCTDADLRRILVHPEQGIIDIYFLLQMYSWHGRHHVAHITSLRERNNWR